MCIAVCVKVSQNTLLKAIVDDDVFGFVQCDVTSPQEMIDKHLQNGFLFPPVISKATIEDDMLSPFMKRLCKKRKLKSDPSPVQTYHGKNQFLLSTLVKLYVEMGLEVTNITKFIQYVPGKGLLPFAKRVVKLRSEATDDGDDAKQLTAKLFGNAGMLTICLCTITH